MASAKSTTDHDEIRQWVEDRGGYPARVKRTGGANDPGILRIDYPGFSGEESLKRISWEEWFDAFDENNLAFLHQDDAGSRFSKLVGARKRSAKKASAKKASTKKRTVVARTPSRKKTTGAKKTASRGRTTSRKRVRR